MFYVVFTSPYKIIWFSIDFNKFTSSFGSTWPSSNFLISLYVLILFLIFLKAFLSNVFLFWLFFVMLSVDLQELWPEKYLK